MTCAQSRSLSSPTTKTGRHDIAESSVKTPKIKSNLGTKEIIFVIYLSYITLFICGVGGYNIVSIASSYGGGGSYNDTLSGSVSLFMRYFEVHVSQQ
jgi:hypothetical protein